MNHLLDWQHIDDATWEKLVARAVFHAENRVWNDAAKHKSLGMLFFNSSLRTRTSMELAAAQLGAFASAQNVGQGTWGFAFGDAPMTGGEAEHIEEAIGVMSGYYDALGVRLFASLTDYEADKREDKMRAVMAASSVPLINLESAFYHPCQALADAGFITQHFGGNPKGKKFVLSWAPHPKALPMAVPNSALLQAARLGMEVVYARPESHLLDESVISLAKQYAAQIGSTFTETDDQNAAFEGADVIYAKAHSGTMVYTHPAEEEKARLSQMNWMINQDKMRRTNNGIFMHCLPVRRDVVVESAVLKSQAAKHLPESQFRLFAQKAILEWVWGL
jgi:N-acetylornithine carbamoyltransferase